MGKDFSLSTGDENNDPTRTYLPLATDTKIGHYRIIEKIGAGGMGEVYLAQDTKLSRKVALKFLPSFLCQDEECRKRFAREAQAAAGLDHPNIAGIYEVGEYNGRPFYSMQLVEGRTLREVIADKDLPIDRLLEIAIQVCEGLQAAHDKGIIHRDIKPSNILIDAHSRVRIVDFGLASISGSEQLTKTGSTLGTIGYMSPEQVQGGETDCRSDMFSLGVVLYELITKQNPFKRDNEAATLKAVSGDTPHPVARYRADVPEGLQAVIDKVLEKDVKTRYQTAGGMLADLVRVKRSLESGHSTVSTVSPERKLARSWWIAAACVAAAAVIVLLVTKPWFTDADSTRPDVIMLAVLPFENLGDPADEYFADGMTEEITSRLASIHELGIISRTSAMQYKGASKSLKDIGRELGVDYILEGTIRWDKGGNVDRIRITPQLVDVSEDRHVWANNYERALTQVFEIQSDIASQIAEALNITLLGSEESVIANWPTDNLHAYDYYLKGRDYVNQDQQRSLAEEMFEKAIELDSSFAMAYADLSHVHSYRYWTAEDPSPQRIEAARTLAEKALELSPGLAEAHLALGYYHYYSGRDYERALEEFDIALRDQPNNSDVLAAVGYVKRRQGKWEEAYELLRKSLKLDPTSPLKSYNFFQTCGALRKHQEAIEECDRILEIYPGLPTAWVYKVLTIGLSMGDTSRARGVVAEAESQISRANMPQMLWHFDVTVGDFEAALKRETRRIDTISTARDSGDFYYNYATIYSLSGEVDKAEAYFDSARICLERAQHFGSAVGHYPDIDMKLAKSYAGLGRKADAIALAQEEVAKLPRTKDAYVSTILLRDLCVVNIMVGEYETAIDILDTLLATSSDINASWVQLHPAFDSLRDHPRFQALIEKYEVTAE
jgi:serine/threonine protein kinase/tetratricopeptide (TPR) repeat protein